MRVCVVSRQTPNISQPTELQVILECLAKATQQAEDSTKQVQEAARMLSEQAERLNAEMQGLLK